MIMMIPVQKINPIHHPYLRVLFVITNFAKCQVTVSFGGGGVVVPGPRGGGWSRGGGACSEGVPAPGGSPGPRPRGKLRDIRYRPTPKGEIERDQVQAHTQGRN